MRATTKRYLWSFSGQPVWFVPTDGIRNQYGIGANYPDAETFIPGWHDVLRDKTPYGSAPFADARMTRLFAKTREYDLGNIDADDLCEALGTPGSWWTLGLLSNPHADRARAAEHAWHDNPNPQAVYFGLNGAVRWYLWKTHDPRGVVNCRYLHDHLFTNDASMHLVTWIRSERACDAVLNIGWDDGIVVRIGEDEVFNRAEFPPVGHGAQFLDKYQFEEHVHIRIPSGQTRLSVTSINGDAPWKFNAWLFNLRITDVEGYPIDGVRFSTDQRDQ